MEIIMSAIDNTPTNKNFLSPLNFQFNIKRAPHVNFFLQKVEIPSISMQIIDIPTVFNYIPDPGNKLNYGDLNIEFKIDENFSNYLEIHNWIRALSFPANFEERAGITHTPEYTGNGIHSDISLIVLNSVKQPNFEIIFKDAFPTSLDTVRFDTTYDDVQYITTSASFKYVLYDIKKIS
jgi:hypothetical protein